MPKSTEKIYNKEDRDKSSLALRELAKQPKTTFTKQEIVESLLEDILEALKNHSYAEVVKTLADTGLEIAEGTLKQYVNRSRAKAKTQSKSKTTKTRKHKSESKPELEKTEKISQPEPKLELKSEPESESELEKSVDSTGESEKQSKANPLPRSRRKITPAY